MNCPSWDCKHPIGQHIKPRNDIIKTKDVENGESRNTVQKINDSHLSVSRRKKKDIKLPFFNQSTKISKTKTQVISPKQFLNMFSDIKRQKGVQKETHTNPALQSDSPFSKSNCIEKNANESTLALKDELESPKQRKVSPLKTSTKVETRDLGKLWERLNSKRNTNKQNEFTEFQRQENAKSRKSEIFSRKNMQNNGYENLDSYESDFIDDEDIENGNNHNKWNDRIVSGVIKQLYGRNKYDYRDALILIIMISIKLTNSPLLYQLSRWRYWGSKIWTNRRRRKRVKKIWKERG